MHTNADVATERHLFQHGAAVFDVFGGLYTWESIHGQVLTEGLS